MQQTDKDNWIKTLRSDKFIQCSGRLQEPFTNNRCALGILFEVMNLNKNKFIEESLKLGLSYSEIVKISRLNDIEQKSFAEIADYIHTSIRGEL